MSGFEFEHWQMFHSTADINLEPSPRLPYFNQAQDVDWDMPSPTHMPSTTTDSPCDSEDEPEWKVAREIACHCGNRASLFSSTDWSAVFNGLHRSLMTVYWGGLPLEVFHGTEHRIEPSAYDASALRHLYGHYNNITDLRLWLDHPKHDTTHNHQVYRYKTLPQPGPNGVTERQVLLLLQGSPLGQRLQSLSITMCQPEWTMPYIPQFAYEVVKHCPQLVKLSLSDTICKEFDGVEGICHKIAASADVIDSIDDSLVAHIINSKLKYLSLERRSVFTWVSRFADLDMEPQLSIANGVIGLPQFDQLEIKDEMSVWVPVHAQEDLCREEEHRNHRDHRKAFTEGDMCEDTVADEVEHLASCATHLFPALEEVQVTVPRLGILSMVDGIHDIRYEVFRYKVERTKLDSLNDSIGGSRHSSEYGRYGMYDTL